MKILPFFLAKAVDKLSIGEALLLSLMGFAIVFVVLLLLIAVIKVLTALTDEKKKAPAAAVTGGAGGDAPIAAVSGKVPAPGSLGECALHTVDDKTAALLMAIVADDLKAPLNELRFVSIREIQEGDNR